MSTHEGERGELFVQVPEAAPLGGIQNLEQLGQTRAQVDAVLSGPRIEPLSEQLGL